MARHCIAWPPWCTEQTSQHGTARRSLAWHDPQPTQRTQSHRTAHHSAVQPPTLAPPAPPPPPCRDNVLVLDIFFEALNYEMIEQKKAYEVAGLLGDIGGQMGLFIGASLLTILEIFDYLYEVSPPTPPAPAPRRVGALTRGPPGVPGQAHRLLQGQEADAARQQHHPGNPPGPRPAPPTPHPTHRCPSPLIISSLSARPPGASRRAGQPRRHAPTQVDTWRPGGCGAKTAAGTPTAPHPRHRPRGGRAAPAMHHPLPGRSSRTGYRLQHSSGLTSMGRAAHGDTLHGTAGTSGPA